MKDNKKLKTQVYLILFIFMFLMLVVVSTYAYFVTSDFHYGNFNIDVRSKGVDTLQIKSDHDISLRATDYNFIKDIGHSISGNTTIDVMLDTTKTKAKYCYNVYLVMPDEAMFDYTSYPRPELSLSILKKENNEDFTPIIDNMDITKYTGKLDVPIKLNIDNINHEIYTTKRINKTISYKAIITFNYFPDVEQKVNESVSYHATLNVDNVHEC